MFTKKFIRKFLFSALPIVLVFITYFVDPVLAQVTPPDFPNCRDRIFQSPGDWAHYDYGIHGIPGIGNLEGSDEVYSLQNGNFLQCFCPVPSDIAGYNGWQTNWWDVDIAGLSEEEIQQFISQGWIFEPNGSGWNLLDDRYLAKNISFSCQRPTPTPPPAGGPPGAPVCTSPPVSVAPLYSSANFSRLDQDTIKISWIVTDGHAQKYGIFYGTNPKDLQWYTEVFGHETNQAIINLVPPGNIYFKVCSIGTCGDKVCGNTIPQVLGATKELPVTGYAVATLSLLVPIGFYFYKRFRLV